MVATLGSTDNRNMSISTVAAAPAGAVDTDAGFPSAVRRPVSPVSAPRAVAPVVASGSTAALEDSPQRHKK